MNISITKLIRPFVCLCLVLSSWIGTAQNYQHHEIMVNGTFIYDFASFPWPNQPTQPNHGETDLAYMGIINGIWQNRLTYTPDPDYVGLDYFHICYHFTPNNTYGCLYFEIEMVDNSVVATNDYVSANVNEVVTVNVLENDASSSGVYNITLATLANNGSLSISSDSTITFIPDAGFKGAAQFHYTICDDSTKCDKAMVTIFYEDNASTSETVNIALKKNSFIDLIVPMHENFGIQTPPEYGNTEVIDEDGVLRYTPYIGFTGADDLTCYYEHLGVTKTITYNISVLPIAVQNTFGKTDFAVTAINKSVTFNVLANDGPSTYVQSNTQPANGTVTRYLGNVTYTPPAGFEGATSFNYTVCLLGTPSCQSVKVYVTTSNYVPAAPEFLLQTAKNTPLVIDYVSKINNWTFTGPVGGESDLGGTVQIFPGNTTQTIHGQEATGYNLLVYTPPSDEIDVIDEFEIVYCAPNGACTTVKIYVNLIDIPASANTDTLCVADCVFPGDANNDGKVNMVDILPIGYCTGVVGTARENASTEWYGQYSADWPGVMGAKEKHVDADGDGSVTALDSIWINEYYGNSSNLYAGPVASLENIPLYFIPQTPNPGPGDLVEIDIVLGAPNAPAFDIYGLSFSLGYNAEIVVPGSMNVNFFDDSWTSYNSPMISYMKDHYADNKVDVAYTRTSDVSASGFGIIGTVSFVIEDVIDLRLNEFFNFNLNFNGSPVTMNAAGEYVTIVGADLQLKINTKPGLNDSENPLISYPNPTDDLLNIHLNGGDELEQVKIFDLVGNLMYDSGSILDKHHTVDVSKFHNGMYIINAFTTTEMLSIKTRVEHE
jgi:Bacterial Ig domain/Secretion system C-terminal sorting domain